MFEFDIYDSDRMKVYALWQYDFGKSLSVKSQYGRINTIHFDNGISGKTIDVQSNEPNAEIVFTIPGEIISHTKPVKIYLYMQNEDGGYTVKRDVLPILSRKSADAFSDVEVGYELQEKTVTPSDHAVSVLPDGQYYGLSKVTVEKIPAHYVIPTGSVDVISNGTYDVSGYKYVNVSVDGGSTYDVATTAELFNYLGIEV